MTGNPPSLLLAHDASGAPIHLSEDELVRHACVVGATGSGKTNQLLAMAAGAVSGGNGLAFVDGKGDLSAYRRILGLARRFGREGDVRLLNFCDRPRDDGARVTNTYNPFGTGTAHEITQFLIGMMEESGGDGAMWKGRAVAMLTGVVRALAHLRDEDLLDFNVRTIRDYVNVRKIIDLTDPEKYPAIPADVRHSIRSYLTSLPGYQEEKKYKQAQTTLDQHGYLEMQFTRVLGAFSDVYGHVFSKGGGEIDVVDLRENNRILVVMLPMVGRSGEERRFLGNTVLSILNGLMSTSNPLRLDAARPAGRARPFVVMLDEFSAFATPGIEVLAAQGRSLGFGFVFSTQTLVPPVHDRDGLVLDAILANTATKILMRTDLVDRERFARIMPPSVPLAQDDALNAMKDRMATIQGLVALQAITGDRKEAASLAWEYAELAGRQKAAFEARASALGADDLQALPTGSMVLVQGGVARRALAYDLTGLEEAAPAIVGHVPVSAWDIGREVADCVDDIDAAEGLPPRGGKDLLSRLGGDLRAIDMLPDPEEAIPCRDMVRLSVAICAAAGEE